jgi:SnoaL-like protein
MRCSGKKSVEQCSIKNKGERMNTEEVAKKLVDYCRKGEWMKAIDDLYSKEIVSVEAREMENMPAEMRGIDQVRGKTEWWEKNMEVHSAKVGGPFVARDTFVVQFDIDVTDKASKKRMQMSEVGIYKVKDGKVAREEFLPLAQRTE